MTNSKSLGVESSSKSDFSSKEKIPYSVPSDAKLLSYWHYQNNIVRPPDLWSIVHKVAESDDEAKQLSQRRHDPNSGLIRQLRGKGPRALFSKSQYVHDMRLLCKWRLLVGQKRDGCIQLEQQLDIEHKKYLQIKQEYKECVSALEQFLSRDHEASMDALLRSEHELSLTMELSERRDELSRRYGHARLDVYHWEEAWRTVRACHRFLHRVSPLGPTLPVTDGNESVFSIEDEASNSTSTMPQKVVTPSDFGNTTSLDSLIAAFEREASGLSKSPAKTPGDLGLNEPGDLLRLFRAIELQNLNALIHLESLSGPMADMIARIESSEVRVKREIDDVLEGIRQLETSIEREERRAQRLERQSERLVQQHFRALICSELALQARVLVEDAYETCVAVNEAGLEPLAMARALENAYEKLSAELDGLPRHLVVACEREGFRQELKESREIEDAARKFELMHRLLGALRRLMEPSEPRRRMLMRRSSPPLPNKTEKPSPSKRMDQLQSNSAVSSPTQLANKLVFDLFSKACKIKGSNDLIEDSDEE